MISRIETQRESKLDWLKWTVVVALLLGGLAANYFYNAQPWPLRLLAWLFVLAIAAGIASLTQQGKQIINFARESRMELRKVVWPTRQEVIQTTLVIGAVVVVLALILWFIDGILVWSVGWLTGQRG
jgi:preprotein translocase subunit SecE